MKKYIISLILILALLLSSCSLVPKDDGVTDNGSSLPTPEYFSIKGETRITLQIGDTYQVELHAPDGIQNEIEWSAGGTSATVSNTGLVTAREEGKTVIYASYGTASVKLLVEVVGKPKGEECTAHRDLDRDGECDYCGAAVEVTDGGECSGEHTDNDNNGSCDGCGISVIITVNLYAINDLHGKLLDDGVNNGSGGLATYIKNAYADDEDAVVLSSGDMWQGSAHSNLTKGLMMTELMNELDFVSMTIGNHEFDWGEEYIEENLELAEFPFLAINIYEKATNERVSYATPSVVVEIDGIQIGIIGAIGDCYSSISGEQVKDVYFKVGSELTELVKAESERLRGLGVDYVIYSLHDGFNQSKYSPYNVSNSELAAYYDSELSSGGYVDLVFEAHTHRRYVLRDSYGVYHLQSGGDNSGISHVELDINYANGNSAVREAEFVSVDVYSALPDDEVIAELSQKYANELAPASRVLGNNKYVRSGDYLRQLVADLYYEAGLERFGDRYDLTLGGGFISVRSPYNLEAGTVTYADLYSLFPFDNALVLCEIEGRYLRSKFFETTNSDYFISYGAYGESVKNNISDNEIYYVITDTYSSSYAPNHLTVVEWYDYETFARDLLAEYIEAGGFAQ